MSKHMPKRFAVVPAILLILSLFPANAVFAQTVEPPSGEVLTENISKVLESGGSNDHVENLFLFQNDLTVQGVTNRQDYYFEIPRTRQVMAGSYIELFFGHSPALIQDRSTITVMLDDEPLGSQFLDQSNVKDAKWKLSLDGRELKTGYHKLSIVIHMEATDDLCMDQNNPANWFILYKESVIHLRYTADYAQGDLSWYPSPFLEKGSLNPFDTFFVVPDQPSEQELFGLAKLSRYFTSVVSNLEYRVYRESDLTDAVLRSGHQIWIGSPGAWRGPGALLAKDALKEAAGGRLEAGAVYVQPSRWNSVYDSLLIMGRDEGLDRAVVMMTDESLYSQLAGSYAGAANARALPAAQQRTEAAGSSNTVTLESLNYGDLVIEGLMVGSARISYLVPAEIDITKGGKLHVYYSHSKSLNFAQSQATIKINDIPVASTYLSKESSDFGVLEAAIPSAALQGNYINADIAFQFGSTSEACTGSSYIGNWAVIDNASYFSFSSLPNRDLKLVNLPYPFVSGSAWNKTTVLLPSQPSSEELTLFAVVNGLYGGSLASYANFKLVTIPEAITGEEPWLTDHLIVICLADKLPSWLNEIDTLPVGYSDQGWQAAIDTVRLTDSTRADAGIIQLFPSPFGRARDILMLSATSPERLGSLSAMLLKSQARELMKGQVLVADSLERMHVFETGQYEPAQSIWRDASEFLITDNMPVLKRLLFVGVIVAVLIVFALIVWFIGRRRRG
jgi:hypothetical protein